MKKNYVFDMKQGMLEEEGAVLNPIDKGLWELKLYFNNSTSKERRVLKNDIIQYGITCQNNIIFLVVKFGKDILLETPYSINLYEDGEKVINEKIETTEDVLLNIRVLDGSQFDEEIVTRKVKLDKDFYEDFLNEIKQQNKTMVSRENYAKALNSVFREYSSLDLFNSITKTYSFYR